MKLSWKWFPEGLGTTLAQPVQGSPANFPTLRTLELGCRGLISILVRERLVSHSEDGAGWNLGAYADFNTENWDNVQFEGAGLTLTIEL